MKLQDIKEHKTILEILKEKGADPCYTVSEFTKLTGYCERNVRKKLKDLESKGIIQSRKVVRKSDSNAVKIYFLKGKLK